MRSDGFFFEQAAALIRYFAYSPIGLYSFAAVRSTPILLVCKEKLYCGSFDNLSAFFAFRPGGNASISLQGKKPQNGSQLAGLAWSFF